MTDTKEEIIDLTNSPAEPIVLSDDDLPYTKATGQIVHTEAAGQRGEGRRPRRKKRKRSVVEGELSGAQTREASTEDGKTVDQNTVREGVQSCRLFNEGRGDNVEKELDQPQKSTSTSQSLQDTTDIFFIDVTPAPLPVVSLHSTPSAPDAEPSNRLLLPAHVSVFGAAPVEILPSSIIDSTEDDYIEYLDYDDHKDLVRYFENTAIEITKKPTRTVCKNCGAEGEHKTAACPVLICLTCGARNEHHTRSCPISKTCFTCGMKGHINATCPNRNTAQRSDLDRYHDCDRCGSSSHKINECPTLWRIYNYLTDDGREHTINIREDRKKLSIGQGGEGYIAPDEWCYNCGSYGHWGDDCQDILHPRDFPKEPSAFSIYNTLSGPFVDSTSSASRRQEPRDWENENVYGLSESWGDDAPDNVGRQARKKNIAKMQKRAKEQEITDDPDDWFGSSRISQNYDRQRRNDKAPTRPRQISFGKSLQDAGQLLRTVTPSAPSLLKRLGDPVHSNDHREQSRTSRTKLDHDHGSSRHNYRHRQDRDQDRHRRREDPGPRYKGGYNR